MAQQQEDRAAQTEDKSDQGRTRPGSNRANEGRQTGCQNQPAEDGLWLGPAFRSAHSFQRQECADDRPEQKQPSDKNPVREVVAVGKGAGRMVAGYPPDSQDVPGA